MFCSWPTRLSKRAALRSNKLRERTLLDISPIVDELAKAQTLFLRAADEIASQHWNTKPEAEKWSGAEVVAHLILVERGVNDAAKRVTQKTPKSFKPWQKMHLPLWLVRVRILRRKSPVPLVPALLGHKENMLNELRATRTRTLDFLEETQHRDLGAYRWKHPFLGSLTTYEWFEMIAAHQMRHGKQVKELARQLPKVVEISQKQ